MHQPYWKKELNKLLELILLINTINRLWKLIKHSNITKLIDRLLNARKVTRNCLHLPYYKNFNYYGDDKMFLKKKWSITFIAMITAFFLAACGGTENANEDAEKADQNEPKTPEVEMTSSVEEVYNNNCTACHGEDLQGNVGPDISKAGSKYTKDEIKDIALNGIGDMPADLVQDEKDAELIAGYLSGLK